MVVGLEELGPQGAGALPLVDQRDVLALGEVAVVVAGSHEQLKIERQFGGGNERRGEWEFDAKFPYKCHD